MSYGSLTAGGRAPDIIVAISSGRVEFQFCYALSPEPRGPEINMQDLTGYVTECLGLTNCRPGVTGCTWQC
jgi:hypothetical protein